VFRSASVRGPWTPYAGNPILTQRHLDPARQFPVTSTGHADFIETPQGEWWAVFLGTRPYRGDFYNTGRETFLMPVRWANGWPVMAAGVETVPHVHPLPNLPSQPHSMPASGNFTLRDEFNAASLSPYWSFVRTPREQWYDLTATPGSLSIRARSDHIGRLAQPSFIARRQQHGWASASAAMRFAPTDAGEAGLVAFQSDEYYYFLGVGLDDGRRIVRLKRRAGPHEDADGAVVAQSALDGAPDAQIYLRIDAKGDRYDFFYALQEGVWIPLVLDADGTILSTHTAGGFVGAMIGMYAHAP
jgi:alpha-N-arabinofuranosidase